MSVTLKDLAARLNLSDTTVSDALKGRGAARVSAQTRQRVRDEALRLGYQPNVHARRLQQDRVQGLTGIFVSEIPHYATYLMARSSFLQNRLASLGYDAPLVIGRGAAPEASRDQLLSLCGQRPAGIVWMTVPWFGGEFTPLLEQYRASGGSLVCLDWQPSATPGIEDAFPVGASGVLFDRFHNTYTVTKHLIDLGHRSLGVFLGPGAEDTHTKLTRGRGVLRACECEESGEGPITLRWFDSAFPPGGSAGADIAERFLALPPAERPTGMALVNDRTAMAFIARVQAAGVRVPEDVSVVGHDDDEMSSFFSVPLTTITHPHRALAETAADMMDRIIREKNEGNGEAQSGSVIEVRGELRVRASTTAPPAAALEARR